MYFFFSSRRRHTRYIGDWSSDVCSSDLREELSERITWFEKHGKLLEAQRLKMRTEYDLEMMEEMGFCSGIENYSRHLRSEERRVGKECRSGWGRADEREYRRESTREKVS